MIHQKTTVAPMMRTLSSFLPVPKVTPFFSYTIYHVPLISMSPIACLLHVVVIQVTILTQILHILCKVVISLTIMILILHILHIAGILLETVLLCKLYVAIISDINDSKK